MKRFSCMLVLTLAVGTGCSTAPPCPSPALLTPAVTAPDILFRGSCDYQIFEADPVCVTRVAGVVLAGPQPNNAWADAPVSAMGPWVEVVGPLPELKHYSRELAGIGAFDFGALPEGLYRLKASACGWQSAYAYVVVSRSAPRGVTVRIELPLGT